MLCPGFVFFNLGVTNVFWGRRFFRQTCFFLNLLMTEAFLHCPKGSAVTEFILLLIESQAQSLCSSFKNDISNRLQVTMHESGLHPEHGHDCQIKMCWCCVRWGSYSVVEAKQYFGLLQKYPEAHLRKLGFPKERFLKWIVIHPIPHEYDPIERYCLFLWN